MAEGAFEDIAFERKRVTFPATHMYLAIKDGEMLVS